MQQPAKTAATRLSDLSPAQWKAGIARLAALLGNREAAVRFTEIGLPYWERIASKPDPQDAWTTSEMLIALQSIIEMEA